MSDYTVLVLGAGASLPYGLPLGRGLVEKICTLLPSNDKHQLGEITLTLYNVLTSNREFVESWRSISSKDFVYALIEFRQRLIESDPKSIDEFLARDFGKVSEAYRLIGKLSIAFIISKNESSLKITEAQSDHTIDHWYRYLWQDCFNAGCKNLDDLKNKKLRVISFNYDRSLEYFLGKRIAASYIAIHGLPLDPIRTGDWASQGFRFAEQDLQIIHPYGTLGTLLDIPYGSSSSLSHQGLQMASSIKVIGEDREKNENFKVASDWLTGAKKIIFLGFSYDGTNMDRLGLSSGLPRRIQTNQSINSRQVFPLTYGLERAERLALTRKYFSDFEFEVDRPSNDYSPISETHQSMQITQYLRRYGGLTGL